MKKLVLSACSIAVAAALITPKMVASQVETQLNQIVEEINSAHGYKANISALQSNWFSTTGNIRVTIDIEDFSAQDVQKELDDFYLDFEIDAQHGPILTQAENGFGLVNMSVALKHEKLREYLTWSNEQPLYGATVFTDIMGNTSYKDAIEAFTVSDDEQAINVKFEGYQGKGIFNNNTLSYEGKSKPTSFSVDQVDMFIGEIDVNMVATASFTEMLQTGLYDSESKMTVETFTFNDKAKDVGGKLDKIYFEALSKVNDEKQAANITVTYGVGSIEADQFKAQDVELALEINNISKAFVTAYQDNAQMFSQGSEAEIQANIMKFAQENLLSLLAAEPQINITSLRATLEDGAFESHLNTSLNGITQLPDIAQDPMFWLPHVLANGEIKGSKAVIERFAALAMESQIRSNPQAANMSEEQIKQIAAQQVPQILQTFVQQGFIIENEAGYQTNFNFKDKALTVNNNPIPLPI